MTTTQTGISVTLPSLGENVTEATITRWLKSVGDSVVEGEALLEVATDKVDTEIPSPTTGTLVELLAAEDAVVEVGAALASIGSADPEPPAPEVPTPAPAAPVAAAVPTAPTDSGDRVEKLPRIRQTIARRMLESLQTSAQLTTVVEVDITEIAGLRTAHKEEFHRRTGTKLSFLPFFVAAAVGALAEHPVVNSSLDTDCTEVTYHGAVHLGMAVDSDKGLMVPVIRHADRLSITELARAIGDSADHVRSGTIRPTICPGAHSRSPTPAAAARCSTPPSSTSPSPPSSASGPSSSASFPLAASADHSRSRCGRWPTCPSPTTTASSTAPTRPGISVPSGSAWKRGST